MASIIQQLKGTAAEVAAKIYPVGVLVWNETVKRWHGGDGVTVGGIAMARYDERNDGSLGYEQRVETAASNAVTIADIGKAIIGNRATAIAFNLDPAASLTSKFTAMFKNIGAGAMTIVPNGAQLIDGANTPVIVPTGASVVIKGDGTSFRSYFSTTDVVNKVSKSGDTMTGQLVLPASTTGLAGLRIPNGVDPAVPTDGDVWRRDAGGGLFHRKGATTVGLVDTQRTIKSVRAQLTDTKAQNTAAQTLTAATWNTRQLNTENYDPENIVSLSSNAFTLASGSDYAVQAVGMLTSTTSLNAVLRFFNVTDGVPVQILGVLFNANASGVVGEAVIEAILTGGKTYRIEHYISSTIGVGNPVNLAGMSEVYLSVMIERLTNGFA